MYGLDLFSGIGGITKALEGYVQPVAYCENDGYARAVLLSRMCAGDISRAPIWDDVRTLSAPKLPIAPDIVYGGFPCQDISVAGRGAGLGGERSGLFFEIARLISEIRPRFIFLENVPAITSRGGAESLPSLPAWGMTLDGSLYPLPKSGPIISENDGGYWPTPTTRDDRGPASNMVDLNRAVKMWPTPTAEPFRSRSGKRKGEMGLDRMAKMWPTPGAADCKGANPKWHESNERHRAKGQHKQFGLREAVIMWPTPVSSDTGSRKHLYSQGGMALSDAAGGQLNPTWVEWLMGYPSGWTVLEDWATQWFRPKRGKRSRG